MAYSEVVRRSLALERLAYIEAHIDRLVQR